jgi:hypothetical protein
MDVAAAGGEVRAKFGIADTAGSRALYAALGFSAVWAKPKGLARWNSAMRGIEGQVIRAHASFARR